MWMITTDGFYSVVDKQQGDGSLTVRARCRADLDRLRQRYLPSLGETRTGEGTDYPHRASVERGDFAAAVAQMAEEVDYPNFKNEVYRRLGGARAHALGDVWRVLLALEQEDA